MQGVSRQELVWRLTGIGGKGGKGNRQVAQGVSNPRVPQNDGSNYADYGSQLPFSVHSNALELRDFWRSGAVCQALADLPARPPFSLRPLRTNARSRLSIAHSNV